MMYIYLYTNDVYAKFVDVKCKQILIIYNPVDHPDQK